MSNRDSIASTTSRFSSLLAPSSASISTTHSSSSTRPSSTAPSSYPIPSSSSGVSSSTTPATTRTERGGGSSLIYDRPVTRSRGSEVSLGAWNYLFGEIVQYTQKQVSGISEFEKRLNILGYRVGTRLLELLPLRDSLYPITSTLSRSPPPPSRQLRLLPLLTYIHSNLYRYLFGKPADSLERSTEHEDEYMIGDDEMLLTKNVMVPKEMKELSCAALVAGIVEGVMDGSGFPARVTAHSVPTQQFPRRTVLLIKLDPSVLERERALSAPTK
ncbi:TRAPP subunit TRS31 [Sporobolomyces salmoneus]|uniref:TRAPP subunit TRS31 n=1 Tax=Sporobolomyces salmoneus TaxID=183962 RepID=UPI00316EE7CE